MNKNTHAILLCASKKSKQKTAEKEWTKRQNQSTFEHIIRQRLNDKSEIKLRDGF